MIVKFGEKLCHYNIMVDMTNLQKRNMEKKSYEKHFVSLENFRKTCLILWMYFERKLEGYRRAFDTSVFPLGPKLSH